MTTKIPNRFICATFIIKSYFLITFKLKSAVKVWATLYLNFLFKMEKKS